jgi:hypothetical protein
VTAVSLVVFEIGAVNAERRVVNLASDAIETFEPADSMLGNFYTLRIDVPEGMSDRKLMKAILELTVDVSTVNRTEYVNETPVFEVYILTSTLAGTRDPVKMEQSSPMRRVVRIGNDRTIRIDITGAVKSFLTNPDSNRGLIMGSLTNSRDGLFNIEHPSGNRAKITYFYADR